MKINQDYQIHVCCDKDGNAYWNLFRKSEPTVCNEEEIRMVAKVFGELKEKIDKQYTPVDHRQNKGD